MADCPDYEALVQVLYERHRSVRDAGFSGDAYKPGLDAMQSYAAFLGHPEQRFRSIHVAGTNGKGSVCSMLAAAFAARGLRVGLYTSPHLVDFRERIKIVELKTFSVIPENEVCRFLRLYDRPGLTFFEVTTGMAFWWFAEEKVDVAVIETGLGGRLDSTNIITPMVSVITSIGLDHCDLLGSTRAEIAAEKAGIFKPGVPAVVWGRDAETQPVFERVAASVGCPLYFAEDFPLPAVAADRLDLTGPCQDLNLRTVLATLAIIDDRDLQPIDLQPHTQNRLPQKEQSVVAKSLENSGLRNTLSTNLAAICAAGRITGFRGRWERLLSDPLTICDIGHNPPALKATFDRLAQLRHHKPLLVVYGAMKDKDVDTIAALLPTDAEYFLVQPDTPRAMPLEELALKLKHFHPVAAGSVSNGVELALRRARELEAPIVYIGGSTFVVSEAITYIESL